MTEQIDPLKSLQTIAEGREEGDLPIAEVPIRIAASRGADEIEMLRKLLDAAKSQINALRGQVGRLGEELSIRNVEEGAKGSIARKLTSARTEMLLLAGSGLISYSAWLVYRPLGPAIAGTLIIAGAILAERGRSFS